MYRVHLDEAAQRELLRRAHQPGLAARTRDRLEMLRLSAAGWSVPRIALHLHTHEQTVRHWVKTYLQNGFDALPDRPHPGKQSAVTQVILEDVRAWLQSGERTWNAAQVAALVQTRHGIARSPAQWRRLLKQQGQSYKRTRRTLTHKQKPELVAAKRAELEALQKKGRQANSTSRMRTKPGSP